MIHGKDSIFYLEGSQITTWTIWNYMQHFTRGLKVHIIMVLDVSVEGTMWIKNLDEMKELIERTCQNEYHFQSEMGVKK